MGRSVNYSIVELLVKRPFNLKTPATNLFHSAQDLADLKNFIHFTVAGKERPQSVEFGHDAAHCPQVDGRVVGGRPQ